MEHNLQIPFLYRFSFECGMNPMNTQGLQIPWEATNLFRSHGRWIVPSGDFSVWQYIFFQSILEKKNHLETE